jgi:hypothetical protein
VTASPERDLIARPLFAGSHLAGADTELRNRRPCSSVRSAATEVVRP